MGSSKRQEVVVEAPQAAHDCNVDGIDNYKDLVHNALIHNGAKKTRGRPLSTRPTSPMPNHRFCSFSVLMARMTPSRHPTVVATKSSPNSANARRTAA